jgi:pimeloyl-ACP methyl ester carboxylesterase
MRCRSDFYIGRENGLPAGKPFVALGPLLSLALTVGCAATAPQRDGEALDVDTNPEPATALRWGSCPEGFEDRCLRLSVPLSREVQDSEDIEVTISKRGAANGRADTQIWLMMGGPGNSADLFKHMGMLDEFAKAIPGADIYTIEHRGVGESTKLVCPEGDPATANEIEACVQALNERYEDQLGSFSTTEAARDVEYALSLTRDEGLPQFLYGVSYGTFLAQRYLQLYPEGVAGVILDSVVLPSQKLNGYDGQTDTVARRIAEICANDPVCSSKLGEDPWSVVENVVQRVEQGHCPEAGVGDLISPILAAYLTVIDLREVVLPLVYRLDRCTQDDVAAMQNSLEYMEATTPDLSRNGNVVRMNILVSELWEHSASEAETLGACNDATLCPGVGPMVLPFVQNWPSYEAPLAGQWSMAATPILTLNGNLDAQTPIETSSRIGEYYDKDYQYFVEFEDGPHGVVGGTPVKDPSAPTCGAQVVAEFLADPTSEPDAECLDSLVPLNVAGNPEKAMRILGTGDVWENAEQ